VNAWGLASTSFEGGFDLDSLESKCAKLDKLAGEAGFWNDAEGAQNTLKQRASLQRTRTASPFERDTIHYSGVAQAFPGHASKDYQAVHAG